MAHCMDCGISVPEQAKFCPGCGYQQPAGDPSPPPLPSAPQPVAVAASGGTGTTGPVPAGDAEALEARIAELRADLESVEEAIEIQSFGFYQPKYGLDTSAEYTAKLVDVRNQQKGLITDGAVDAPKNWIVDGSVAKGKQMLRDQSQLMLRAFNGECDAAVGKVKYDNVEKLEKRIDKSFTAINKLGSTNKIAISKTYRQLKLAELFLVHEHREKVYEEREEQRLIKEQMREEQKAQKEIEKAQRDAEKQEDIHQKALEKARSELAESTGKQHDRLETLVKKLESELAEVIDRKAKSIARAQLTRSGHVYVLSNIGSFGDNMYKIGMTRRFEPLDRVHELGDASVPFRFDVHAMIYSEDAPTLEAMLHQEFADRRVNKINTRREYFRVTLDEIQAAVARHFGTVTFVTVPEAEEFRKTRAMDEAHDELPGRDHTGSSL